MILFTNCRLIDGTSDTVREGMHVLVEGKTIKEVSDVPITVEGAQVFDLAGKTLMPGLIDAHSHVYSIHLNSAKERGMPHTLMMAHAVHRVRDMLMRGFTTVRDVAGGDWGIKTAVEIGLVEGPRLYVSGRALSQTGGHGDHREITDETIPCACTSALDIATRLADGPDQVQRFAREELRKGADHIKIMVSGGVGSPSDKLENTQYQMDEIRAAVLEAEARGTYVCAHSYTAKSTRRALEGGVRTIEHANFIDLETAKFAAEKNAFIVPTLICYRESADNADEYGLRPEVKQKLAEVNEAGLRMLEICDEAGVAMGFGTDLMGEMIAAQSKEFALRANVLKPMDILKSATSVNAEILNETGRLGCIAVGAFADLLVIDGDPTQRIELLEPRYGAILAIMKGGRFHKQAID
ncbi:amidohydrolase family protein [Novosphingobium profundi]|uniref:metal-dependent hydrolase family protein n=1 Tax=Novosphingobium profundi TaxID=1774954 RepID=UPI001BDACD82|nr:amidohydrolase family protein [Novosphingobium profundi]MBT0670763.1 amidohydrolase family protein [Novosphingobium profundi]